MALRAPLVLTCPAKPHRGSLPPRTGHRALFQPRMEPAVPAPAILHGHWSPALSKVSVKELLCWFVLPALSIVSECMFRVAIYIQSYCCWDLGRENFSILAVWAWRVRKPLGLSLEQLWLQWVWKEQSHVPKDHCIQLSLTELIFYLYPCHVVAVLVSHMTFNFRHFMLFPIGANGWEFNVWLKKVLGDGSGWAACPSRDACSPCASFGLACSHLQSSLQP